MFSFEFCEVFGNTFLYRTPPMATFQEQLVFLEILQKKRKTTMPESLYY